MPGKQSRRMPLSMEMFTLHTEVLWLSSLIPLEKLRCIRVRLCPACEQLVEQNGRGPNLLFSQRRNFFPENVCALSMVSNIITRSHVGLVVFLPLSKQTDLVQPLGISEEFRLSTKTYSTLAGELCAKKCAASVLIFSQVRLKKLKVSDSRPGAS